MKNILTFLLLLIANYCCYAQGSDNDFTGSVKSSAIPGSQNQVSTNVDFSRGVITPAIPITSISSSSLLADVNLVYTSGSGVRVNDYASQVGLGWTVNTGGYIKRTVRGIPDESSGYSSSVAFASYGWLTTINAFSCSSSPPQLVHTDNNSNKFGYAIEWDKNNPSMPSGYCGGDPNDGWNWGCEQFYEAIMRQTTGYSFGQISDCKRYDSEPDLFEFKFGNYSGTFVFDKDGNPVLVPYQNIEIQLANLLNGGGTWIFTTPDGTKYSFPNNDTYREISTLTVNTGSSNVSVTNCNESTGQESYVSTWYLSSIQSLSGDVINFTYQTESALTYSFTNTSEQDYQCGPITNGSNPSPHVGLPGGNANVNTIISSPKRIYRITIPDNSYIEFVDYTSNRTDLPGQHALQYIKQYNFNGQLQKEFEFIYDYFHSGCSCSGPDCFRLKLVTLKQNLIGSASLAYRFHYNESVDLPKRNSAHQDLWGYYNFNASTSLVPGVNVTVDPDLVCTVSHTGATRNPNSARTVANILTEIIYPSGGSSEFIYQQNIGPSGYIGGARIWKIVQRDYISTDHIIQPSDNVTEYVYGTAEVSMDNTNSLYEVNRFFQFHNYDNDQDGRFDLDHSFNFISRNGFPNFMHSTDYFRYTNVEVRQTGNGKTTYELTGFSDRPDENPLIRLFNNTPSMYGTTIQQSQKIKGMKSDKSYERGLITKECIYDDTNRKIKETNYIYEFYDPNEQRVIGMKAFNNNFFTAFSNGSVVFQHGFTTHLEYFYIISKSIYLKQTTELNYDVNNNSNYVQTDKFFYYNSQNHNEVTSVKTVTQGTGKEFWTYNKYVKDYSVPSAATYDDASTAIINLNANKINTLIQCVNTIKKSSQEFIIGASLNKFKVFSGITLPNQTYVFEFSSPQLISGNAEAFINNLSNIQSNGTFQYNSSFQLESTIDNYSELAQPILSHKKNDIFESILWSSISPHKPVAKFSNAKYSSSVVGNECSFTGFENGTDNDQWGLGSTSSSTDAHTGASSRMQAAGINFGPGKDFLPDNQYQKYKFSCWVKTEAGFASGLGKLIMHSKPNNSSVVQYPVVNSSWITVYFGDTQGKWKYYEAIIDLGQVRSDGNINTSELLQIRCYTVNDDPGHYLLVDDIRFQPVLSIATSYTYDGLTGLLSSESDINSNPSYTEYDGFGRIILIRDKDKNILKKIAHNVGSLIDPVITCSEEHPVTGESVTFNSNKTYSRNPIVSYSWVITGPSSPVTSSAQSFSHTFTISGDYQVSLSIMDDVGGVYTRIKSLHVDLPLSVTIQGPGVMYTNVHCNASEMYWVDVTGGTSPYTYRWERDTQPGVPISFGDETAVGFTWDPPPGDNSHVIECTVKDSQCRSTVDTKSVAIAPANGCD